jgi:hypothetical protein
VASFKNFLTKSAWHELSHFVDNMVETFKAVLEELKTSTENFKMEEYKHKFTWEQTDRRVMKGEED